MTMARSLFHRSVLSFLTAFLLATPGVAQTAARYDVTIVPIEGIGPGFSRQSISNIYNEISNNGTVVGFHHQWNRNAPGDDPYTPALYSGGKLTPLTMTFGGATTTAYAINALGHFVGVSATASDARHAYLFADGRMQDLGTLGKDASCAYGINDNDEVVGEAWVLHGQWTGAAFIYRHGGLMDLNKVIAPNPALFHGEHYTLTAAHGINNKGDILVSGHTASGENAILLYSGGKLTAPDPGFQAAHHLIDISRLNDNNEFLANDYNDQHLTHAYIFSGGAFHLLAPSDKTRSEGFGINAGGDVVGGIDHRAFLYAKGKIENLNDLVDAAQLTVGGKRYVLRYATSINDGGIIVGNASVGDAPETAIFILTPRSHWSRWLFIAGLLGLAIALAGGFFALRRSRAKSDAVT